MPGVEPRARLLGGAPVDDTPVHDDTIRAALRVEVAGGATKRDAIATVATGLGLPRKQVYALAIASDDHGPC